VESKYLKSALLVSFLALAACEPGVHLSWDKDFEKPIDPRCVEQALLTVVPRVERTTYVSDGHQGMPAGIEVTQLSYLDTTRRGNYFVDLAKLPDGRTRFHHEWGKIGTAIDSAEQQRVLPLLNRANDAIARQCQLSFSGTQLQSGKG
jgi:hypothetical protein